MNDIIYSVDGRQIVALPGFSAALYLHPPDETLHMEVVRGGRSECFSSFPPCNITTRKMILLF